MSIFQPVALFVLMAASGTHAQTETLNVPATNAWQGLQQYHFPAKAEIVLAASPSRRHTCRVKSVKADSIACSRYLGRDVEYRREDIQEIIARRHDTPVWSMLLVGGVGFGGGILTGAVYLAMLGPAGIAAAVPVGLIGVLVGGTALIYSLYPEDSTSVYVRKSEPAREVTQ